MWGCRGGLVWGERRGVSEGKRGTGDAVEGAEGSLRAVLCPAGPAGTPGAPRRLCPLGWLCGPGRAGPGASSAGKLIREPAHSPNSGSKPALKANKRQARRPELQFLRGAVL